jgi:hypothetical protein
MHIQTSEQEKMNLGFRDYTCNWGTHICGLYETERERDEIIMGFLHEGDTNGDFQIFIPSEQTGEEFGSKYCEQYPECCSHVHDNELFTLVKPEEFYYPDGKFDRFRMIESHNEYFNNSQANGKRYIRATAEMVWALKQMPGIENLMAYEASLNYFFPGKPWISICLYNVNRFSGNIIMNVLRTHPYVISGGIIMANPYFMDPGEWLKKFDGKGIKQIRI